MRVRFLISGNAPGIGPFKKGDVRDLLPGKERILIDRKVAELSSIEDGYKPKEHKKEKKKKEVEADGRE